MKTTKKLLIISFFCMTLTSLFLIPIAPAQDVVYDGANTQRFPYFSIYPSEIYEFNWTLFIDPEYIIAPETYYRFEFINGNETGYYLGLTPQSYPQKGYGIWANRIVMNATGTEPGPGFFQEGFWNESIPFVGHGSFIPVDNSSGQVSPFILNTVADYYQNSQIYPYENQKVYPSIYSIHLWNGTGTDNYRKINYTADGIRINYEIYYGLSPLTQLEYTLISQPAQLPPTFSFTTKSGSLKVRSKRITLDLTIPYADNNNDGVADTDYEYRTYDNTTTINTTTTTRWSDWAPVTPSIEYNLGSVLPGDYTLVVEVKNMYGITEEKIEVEYIGEDAIPGYSGVLIMVILAFSISILLMKYRKKK